MTLLSVLFALLIVIGIAILAYWVCVAIDEIMRWFE